MGYLIIINIFYHLKKKNLKRFEFKELVCECIFSMINTHSMVSHRIVQCFIVKNHTPFSISLNGLVEFKNQIKTLNFVYNIEYYYISNKSPPIFKIVNIL